MKDKDSLWVGFISFTFIILFLGYGLAKNNSDILDFNFVHTSTVSIGGISEVVEILDYIKESVQLQNESVEFLVAEGENENLIEGLISGEYDVIVISNPIPNQNGVEEFLFGFLNQEVDNNEDNLIYIYTKNNQFKHSGVPVYLKHYYAQPLEFINTESVFALQDYIYEETLDYINLLQIYPGTE